MTSAWLNSWGAAWGDSWGANGAVIAPAIDPGAGGGKKKKGLRYNADSLADVRQIEVDRILAERAAKEANPDVAQPQEEKPVLMAGGVLVPPMRSPASITLGDIIPELAMLRNQLQSTEINDDDNRRRLLLLT